MIVELLALSTAFLYGCNSILTKKGLSGSNPFSATLVSSITNFVFTWIFFFSNPTFVFSIEAVFFFGLGGILASFFGRTLDAIGIGKVGVSINSSIIGSFSLFSTITAIILLNERFNYWIYLGIIVIVIGIVVLSQKKGKREQNWKGTDILWPLMSSICYGTSATVRKMGLNIINHPMFGVVIGSSVSLGSYLLYLIFTKRMNTVVTSLNKRSVVFFSSSGICTSLAWIFSYTATSKGHVTIVSSLVGTYPLFVLLLSYVFLRENITIQTLVGCILIVVGVVTITLL